MSYSKILVCLDLVSDEAALVARATSLAADHHASLTFLHVIDSRSFGDHGALAEAARARVDALVRDAAAGLEARTIVRVNYPLTAILDEAAGYELVMTGADHCRRLGQLLLGGTTTKVLRACQRPVLVVKSDHHEPARVVLAAVSLHHADDDPHDPLDRQIVTLAHELASRSGGALHVAHVHQAWVPFAGIDAEMAAQQRRGHDAARARLDGLLEACGVALGSDRVHLLEGDPSQELRGLCKLLHVELVVIGTVARGGIAGLIVGNTAEKLMRELGCSLLALKPAGFTLPRS